MTTIGANRQVDIERLAIDDAGGITYYRGNDELHHGLRQSGLIVIIEGP